MIKKLFYKFFYKQIDIPLSKDNIIAVSNSFKHTYDIINEGKLSKEDVHGFFYEDGESAYGKYYRSIIINQKLRIILNKHSYCYDIYYSISNKSFYIRLTYKNKKDLAKIKMLLM